MTHVQAWDTPGAAGPIMQSLAEYDQRAAEEQQHEQQRAAASLKWLDRVAPAPRAPRAARVAPAPRAVPAARVDRVAPAAPADTLQEIPFPWGCHITTEISGQDVIFQDASIKCTFILETNSQ